MVECDRQDLVCLHLDAFNGLGEGEVVPTAVTATGIGDALEVGEAAAGRVDLLETLSTLEAKGLVATEERQIEGFEAPRLAYFLTEAGRTHAEQVRERVREESVVVTNGTSEQISLTEIDRYLDTRAPLVTALVRLTDGEEVPLETHTGAGFVGREEELTAVREGIADSFRRECQTVVVAGASGMGKSALVREATTRVADNREELVVAEGTTTAGTTAPYAAIEQAFEALPGGDQLREARETDVPDDPESVTARRTALFNDIADDLRSISTAQPVVIVLENLQWADEATIELFVHLATAVEEMVYPVAFVGTYREPPVAAQRDHRLPDALDRIAEDGSLREVHLGPFTRAETRALLADVIGRQRLPEAFVELVHEHTGGNPLFVRETATHLLETAQVERDQQVFPTSPEELRMPTEVTDQIHERIRNLDEASRELLRLGALQGERVDGSVLAEASGLPATAFREYVDALVAGRIWKPIETEASDGPDQGFPSERQRTDPSPGREISADLQFVSGGLREAVVERVETPLAKAYHRRIANAFVAVHGDSDAHAGRVAHHYDQADEETTAIRYYWRAGDYAAAAYAHEDALDHYERAVALDDQHDILDDSERATLNGDLAEVSVRIGEFDDARAVAMEGAEIAAPDSRERCRLVGIEAEAWMRQGDFEQARDAARRQRDLAAALDADDLQGEAIHQLGWIAMRRGEYDRASECYRESLELAREAGDRTTEAHSRKGLGGVAIYRGNPTAAREHFQESLAIAREIGDRQLEGANLVNLGGAATLSSEYDDAREHFERSLDILEEIGDRHTAAHSHNNLGDVTRRQGDYDSAREHAAEALTLYRSVGDRRGEALSRNNLGDVARRQGRLDAARDHYEHALDIARDVEDRREEGTSLRGLAALARRRAEYERASELLEEALALFEDLEDQSKKAQVQLEQGRLALAQEDLEAARQRSQDARETFDELTETHWLGRSYRLLGRVAATADEMPVAHEYWRAALDVFESVLAPDDELATLEHLLETGDLDDPAYCERAHDVLTEAPDPVVDRHRAWVERRCGESDA